MHSKQIGNIGETAVTLDLMKRGYPVFSEMGDSSKVDLITLVDHKPIKIQVKSYPIINDTIGLCLWSKGPGYKYFYKPDDFDVFAAYVQDLDIVLYFTFSDFGTYKGITIRFNECTKSNQRFYKDYLNFPI